MRKIKIVNTLRRVYSSIKLLTDKSRQKNVKQKWKMCETVREFNKEKNSSFQVRISRATADNILQLIIYNLWNYLIFLRAHSRLAWNAGAFLRNFSLLCVICGRWKNWNQGRILWTPLFRLSPLFRMSLIESPSNLKIFLTKPGNDLQNTECWNELINFSSTNGDELWTLQQISQWKS